MATKRSLLPREHGAYAQLAFPLLTGLAMAFPSLAAPALALAAVAFFLANEPVVILLGARGPRLKEQEGGRARRRAGLLLVLAVTSGALGLVMGWPAVWPEVLVPAASALLLVPLVLLGKQKTLSGEFLALTAFSTLVLPLAGLSGGDPLRAWLAAGVWWLSFALGTLEVHAIKARIKKRARRRWTVWVSPLAAVLAVGAALWAALGQAAPLLRTAAPDLLRLLPPAAAALLPPALAILILSLARVHPKHLKRVGWTLVGANALTLLLLLQG